MSHSLASCKLKIIDDCLYVYIVYMIDMYNLYSIDDCFFLRKAYNEGFEFTASYSQIILVLLGYLVAQNVRTYSWYNI